MAVSEDEPGREIKPILARVRSDGPLLPPLQVELCRYIAAHYLAPPALVLRAMLAPGMLERVERVVRHVDGGVETEWSVLSPEAREKVERRVRLTDAGRAAAVDEGNAARLGPRQREVLAELIGTDAAVPQAQLATRHGSGAIPGLARRGMVEIESARVERRPLAGRGAPVRGTRPEQSDLTHAQRDAV